MGGERGKMVRTEISRFGGRASRSLREQPSPGVTLPADGAAREVGGGVGASESTLRTSKAVIPSLSHLIPVLRSLLIKPVLRSLLIKMATPRRRRYDLFVGISVVALLAVGCHSAKAPSPGWDVAARLHRDVESVEPGRSGAGSGREGAGVGDDDRARSSPAEL